MVAASFLHGFQPVKRYSEQREQLLKKLILIRSQQHQSTSDFHFNTI